MAGSNREKAKRKAQQWLRAGLDEETNRAIEVLLKNENELIETFLNDLEFGTGGLRGIMGVGTARINRYTIGMATQGLANYLVKNFPDEKISVAIAFDSRNNSKEFATNAAEVLSASGIQVFLFEEMRPTPLLSYCVRELKCNAGIVVTASHNPPEYNGYKVYWNDGGQVVPPHDRGIIEEVRKISSPAEVNFHSRKELITSPGKNVETSYLDRIAKLVHLDIQKIATLKLQLVYTSIHGAGITLVPKALEKTGFRNVSVVPEQAVGDGNFPTVKSPNPEEREALSLALKLAESKNADLVIGTDPDTDRVGMAVRNNQNELVLLNGNQAGALIAWYELSSCLEKNGNLHNSFIAKTIVTSDLITAIGEHFGVNVYETLTGFKYIAEVIKQKEGTEKFICGGEESYGYLIDDFVRDKDGVISSVVLSEIAAWAELHNTSVWNILLGIYKKFGFYYDELVNVTIPGLDGVKQIRERMNKLRNTPPATLGGSKIVKILDFEKNLVTETSTGKTSTTGLPVSDVMQFCCEDGSRITARPSGTEPKIKFYFSLRSSFDEATSYEEQNEIMQRTARIIRNELVD